MTTTPSSPAQHRASARLSGPSTPATSWSRRRARTRSPIRPASRPGSSARSKRALIADAALAQSIADAQSFWTLRDAAGEFRQTLGPDHASFDIGLPTGGMGEYVEACRHRLEGELPGIIALFYGHIGDGNLHIVAAVPGASSQPKDLIDQIVYDLVRERGGTVSAEHGIGTRKKRWLPYARSAEEIALMRTLKQALDPWGILNPGKVLEVPLR